MSDPREVMQVRIFGPAVTKEHAREVGDAAADLVNTVAEHMGAPAGLVRVGEVYVACDADGCDTRRPWDSAGNGWLRSPGGHDYCPVHAAERAA